MFTNRAEPKLSWRELTFFGHNVDFRNISDKGNTFSNKNFSKFEILKKSSNDFIPYNKLINFSLEFMFFFVGIDIFSILLKVVLISVAAHEFS